MAEKEEFYNFDEALDRLHLKEEELKRLVSEGEIRAFREGETMRLRKNDVEQLKNELTGGEVVDLGDAGEELVFEDDLDFEEAGMATEEISDMDTLLEEDVEDVGEIEIEEEVVVAGRSAAPAVRRTSVITKTEESTEGMGIRFAMIATSLVLVLLIPITISISTGQASDMAKTIAGIFGASFE